MDSGATKHVTLYKTTFDIYDIIALRNVHLGDDGIVKSIGMGSIYCRENTCERQN